MGICSAAGRGQASSHRGDEVENTALLGHDETQGSLGNGNGVAGWVKCVAAIYCALQGNSESNPIRSSEPYSDMSHETGHNCPLCPVLVPAGGKTGLKLSFSDHEAELNNGDDETAKHGENAGKREEYQRTGWDLNPRSPFGNSGFQDRCNQPLCHPSPASTTW